MNDLPRNRAASTAFLFVVAALVLGSGCSRGAGVLFQAVRRYETPTKFRSVWQSPRASNVIGAAQSVGFVPPAECRTRRSGRPVTKIGKLDCFGLMAELESAARRRGFVVVPWRSLSSSHANSTGARGALVLGAAPPRVDLLLKVSERRGELDPRVDLRPRELRYLAVSVRPETPQRGLEVADRAAVDARCSAQIDELQKVRFAVTELRLEVRAPAAPTPVWRMTQRFSPFLSVRGNMYAQHQTRLSGSLGGGRVVTASSFAAAALLVIVPFFIPKDEPTDPGADFMIGVGGAMLTASILGGFVSPLLSRSYALPRDVLCRHGSAYWRAPAVGHGLRVGRVARLFATEAIARLVATAAQQGDTR